MNPDNPMPNTTHENPNLPSARPLGSALSREQLSILDHTEHRAAGGYYCGGGKDMDALVAAGLMEYAGR